MSQIAHLFIDASNVNVRQNEIPALDHFARAGFSRFATTFVAGSSEGPSPKPEIWRSLDYQVRWSERHHGQPEREYNVDTLIVSAMQRDMLQHSNDASNRVLVLLSGDGNYNDGLPSFREAVEQALTIGWAVKLVCYIPNCVYFDLQRRFPGQMQIEIINQQQLRGYASSRSHTPSVPLQPGVKGPVPCTFFAAGFCRNGDSCRFLHEDPRHVAVATAPDINIPKSYDPPASPPSHPQQAAESHGPSRLLYRMVFGFLLICCAYAVGVVWECLGRTR
jgi:hypothetical protein